MADGITMNVSTLLGDPTLSVAAGEEVTCDIQVRNVSGVVDQLSIDVVGPAAPWATVEPATVNLLPGSEATVTVSFSPPRGPDVRAGSYPFGVRVGSREEPDSASVEEGHVEVEPFSDLDAELLPAKRRGRRKATYKLAVENSGNAPARVDVLAVDPEDDQLDIRLDREYFTLQPGTVALLKVRVKPFDRFLRGDPRTHGFEFRVNEEPQDWEPAPELVVKGTMVQDRLMPSWVMPALILLTVLALALTALWFAVVAPNIRTIASQQVEGKVDEASKAAAAASSAAAQAGGAADKAHADLSSAQAATATTSVPQPTPLDFRIATFADPTTDGSYRRFTYTAPNNKKMQISDMFLQNPRGDKGFMRIAIGDKVLLEIGLADLTDTPYSFTNTLQVNAGEPVVVAVNCVTPGGGSARCTPSASFSAKVLP